MVPPVENNLELCYEADHMHSLLPSSPTPDAEQKNS